MNYYSKLTNYFFRKQKYGTFPCRKSYYLFSHNSAFGVWSAYRRDGAFSKATHYDKKAIKVGCLTFREAP